eukprot:5048403-Amphidinium_carterae.2
MTMWQVKCKRAFRAKVTIRRDRNCSREVCLSMHMALDGRWIVLLGHPASFSQSVRNEEATPLFCAPETGWFGVHQQKSPACRLHIFGWEPKTCDAGKPVPLVVPRRLDSLYVKPGAHGLPKSYPPATTCTYLNGHCSLSFPGVHVGR